MLESNNETPWYGDVSAETRSDIEANKWTGVGDVITAYSELKNKGSDFKIPDGKNTDEMGKFYNKLGRPETPDGYKFEMSDYDQESSYSGFKEAAFKNGLTSAQAEGLYGDTDAFLKDEFDKRTQTMERMKENSLKELKQEWGKDYEDKMSSARNAFKNMGLDEQVAEEVGKIVGLTNTVKLFDALANSTKEHSFVGDGGAVGATKEALTDELYNIRNNPDYLVEGKNKLLIKRSSEIHKMLYPDK